MSDISPPLREQVAHLCAINRGVRSVLAHQRKNNCVDVSLILQRIDHKFTRQRFTFENSSFLEQRKHNVFLAMEYLVESEGYPYMGNKFIDDLISTTHIHIEMEKEHYTELEYNDETNEVFKVRKWRPVWVVRREDWDGVLFYLGKKFNSISDLDAWLDLKYRYVPRVEPNTNLVDFQV